MLSLSKVFFTVRGKETHRVVMANGGTSNTGFAMTIGKGCWIEHYHLVKSYSL